MTRAGKAVGIDIGGTKIAVATVTAAAGVVREATILTDSAEGFASGVRRIRDAVARVVGDSGWMRATWTASASGARVRSTRPGEPSTTPTPCPAGWTATS